MTTNVKVEKAASSSLVIFMKQKMQLLSISDLCMSDYARMLLNTGT